MTDPEFDPFPEFDGPAAEANATAEYASNFGRNKPQHEWIATPWDTWGRNPHYTGKPSPHPETKDHATLMIDDEIPF